MRTIHLGVVELEGEWEGGLEPSFVVTAPRHEGIVEDATVLIDDAVELCAGDCRGAHNDGFGVEHVLTGVANGVCQMQVVGIEGLQIIADSHIAEAESTLDVIYYHIDGHVVVLV